MPGIILVFLYGLLVITHMHELSRLAKIFFMVILAAGCVGMHYKKFLRHWVYCIGTVILIAFASASTGLAENLVYFHGGTRLRMRGSLGVIFTSDCASWVLFFLMFAYVVYEKIPELAMLAISSFGLMFIWQYCNGKCATYCMVIFMMAVAYRIFEIKVVEEKGKCIWAKKIVDVAAYLAMPLSATLMFVLSILYGKGSPLAYFINKNIDNRLRHS